MNPWPLIVSCVALLTALVTLGISLVARRRAAWAQGQIRHLENALASLRADIVGSMERRVSEQEREVTRLSKSFHDVKVSMTHASESHGTAFHEANVRYASSGAQRAAPEPMTSLEDFYGEWCRTGRRPPLESGDLEVVPLRYSDSEQASGLEPPVHVFEDAGQVAEFVRIARRGYPDRAAAFPHPEANFRPSIRFLFDGLSESQFAGFPRPQLADTNPVPIKRRADGMWIRST